MKDYYQILGLEKSASQEEIKAAFRLYANKFHPDKQKGDKFFERRFIEIKEAYDTLGDLKRKSIYDKSLNQNLGNQSNTKSSDYYSKKEQDLRKKEAELNRKEKEFRENKWKETREKNESKKAQEEKVYFKDGNVLLSGKTLKIGYGSAKISDIERAELIVQSKRGLRVLGYFILLFAALTLFIYIGIIFFIAGIYLIFRPNKYFVRIVFKRDIDQVIEAEDKLFASNMLKQINKAVEDYSQVASPT